MRPIAKTIAYAFGIVYLVVGLVGFAVTGFGDFVGTEGHILVLFEVNPLHNIVHLGVGIALIAGAASNSAGLRGVAWTIAGVYALTGVLGFFIAGTDFNILALNTADHFLHLTTAAILVWVAAQTRVDAPAELVNA